MKTLVGEIIAIVASIFVFAASALAATYYVDYQNGSDTNNGTSTATPWKHCRGDSNAVTQPDTQIPIDFNFHATVVVPCFGTLIALIAVCNCPREGVLLV